MKEEGIIILEVGEGSRIKSVSKNNPKWRKKKIYQRLFNAEGNSCKSNPIPTLLCFLPSIIICLQMMLILHTQSILEGGGKACISFFFFLSIDSR